MNDTFNLARFGRLLKKTLVERNLLISGNFIMAMLVTWLFYNTNETVGTEWIYSQRDAFGLGIFLSGGFLPIIIFANFSRVEKGYDYLTLPTSHFEKWLCGFVIVAVSTLLYLVYFRILDASYVANYHKNLNPTSQSYKQDFGYAHVMPFDIHFILFIYKVYFSLTGFIAIAAFYFNTHTVIKGALSFIGICIAGESLNNIIGKSVFNFHQIDAHPFYSAIDHANNHYAIMPENWLQIINPFFLIGLPVILWLVALIRLREKEF